MLVQAELEFDFIEPNQESKEINKQVKKYIRTEDKDCKVIHLNDKRCLIIYKAHQRELADRLFELGYYNSLKEAQEDLNNKIKQIDVELDDPLEYEMKKSIYDKIHLANEPDGFIEYLMKTYHISDHQLELETKIPFEDLKDIPFNMLKLTKVYGICHLLMIKLEEIERVYQDYAKNQEAIF